MSADVNIVVGAEDRASAVINDIAGKVAQFSRASTFTSISSTISGVRDAFGLLGSAFNTARGFIQPFIDEANKLDELNDVALGLGESVSDVQAFTFAMEEAANVDFEQSISALQKLRVVIAEIASGKNMAGQGIFAMLGLDANNMAGKSPIAQFIEIRNALAGVADMGQRSMFAKQLLGKSAANLAPAMVGEQFGESLRVFKELIPAVTQETLDAIGDMNDAIKRAGVAFDGLQTKVLEKVAPAMSVLADHINDVVADLAGLEMDGLVNAVDSLTIGMIGLTEYIKAITEMSFEPQKRSIEAMQKAIADIGARRLGLMTKEKPPVNKATEEESQAFSGMTQWEKLPGIIAKLEQSLLSTRRGPDFAQAQEMLAAAGNNQDARNQIQDLIVKNIFAGLEKRINPQNELEQERQNALELARTEEQRAQLNAFFDTLKSKQGAAIRNATPDLQAVESRLLTRGRARDKGEELLMVFDEYHKTYRRMTKEQIDAEKRYMDELKRQHEEREKGVIRVKIVK